MKNSFGNNLTVTLSGESHGKAITVIIDGIVSGWKIDGCIISDALKKRRPDGVMTTARIEKDEFSILSGIYDGFTTGTPICISVKNEDVDCIEYNPDIIRPGHADLTSYYKYGEHRDWRGGGLFSGRLTVGLVCAGAVVKNILENKGIKFNSFVESCGGKSSADEIKKAVLDAKASGDSLGGIVKTEITGMPFGIGEPFFDSIESIISHAVFSIPGAKGIEFGDGFGFCGEGSFGSNSNDDFFVENGKIITKSNHNGGINGGISNGMPIAFRTAFKPTPSISREQNTVNLGNMTEIKHSCKGRHDPAFVLRTPEIVSAVASFAIYDLICSRYGTEYFKP